MRVGGGLLPERFTLADAQRLYEALRGEPIDAANFRRDVRATGLLETDGGDGASRARPARLGVREGTLRAEQMRPVTPQVALTFDDGPHPEWTPAVLDVLARHGARATFFPLSARALTHPELVARARAEGHAVGLHGWGHLRHPEHARTAVAADTDLALTAFAAPVRWWRLPYGMAAPWSAELAAERGLEIAGWTHDTHDWRGDSAESMRFEPQDGDVVLLHDALGPGVRRETCAETVALVEQLLAAGHASVTLDELGAVPSGRPG